MDNNLQPASFGQPGPNEHAVLNNVETDGTPMHDTANPVPIDSEEPEHVTLAPNGEAPTAGPLDMVPAMIAPLQEPNAPGGVDEPMATIVPHAPSEKNKTDAPCGEVMRLSHVTAVEPTVTNRQLPTVTPSPATGHVVLHAPDNGTEAMVDAVPSQLGRQP